MYSLILIIALTTLLSYLLSIFLSINTFVKKLSKDPSSERWSKSKVSTFGGIGIITSYLVGVLVAYRFGLFYELPIEFWTVLIISTCMGFLGFLDDLIELRPSTKFISQILLSIIAVSFGIIFNLSGNPLIDFLVTIFWIVAITNAVNLMDNMDGLAGGIVAIGAILIATMALQNELYSVAIFVLIIVAAIAGFLINNFPPAKIFMGDSGSHFLGSVIAMYAIITPERFVGVSFATLIIPIMFLALPIFDTAFVTITRLIRRQPISHGGRDHLSHRLVLKGISERTAVLFFYLLSLTIGSIAFFLDLQSLWVMLSVVSILAIGIYYFGSYLVSSDNQRESGITEDSGTTRVKRYLRGSKLFLDVTTDMVLIGCAHFVAYLLRFEQNFQIYLPYFIASLPIVVGCRIIFLKLFGMYSGTERHFHFRTMRLIIKANLLSSITAVAIILMIFRFEGFSRAVFVIDFVLSVLVIVFSRSAFHFIDHVLKYLRVSRTRMFIAGSFEDLNDMIGYIDAKFSSDYEISFAFVPAESYSTKGYINNIPIIRNTEEFFKTLEKEKHKQALFVNFQQQDTLAIIREKCHSYNMKIIDMHLSIDVTEVTSEKR